jgi:acyl-coenzyme A synthetase/AMP-(fatty) acid ligase
LAGTPVAVARFEPHAVLDAIEDHDGTYLLSMPGMCSALIAAQQARHAGSFGRPAPGVEVAVVDRRAAPVPAGTEGEMIVRSGANMIGYWNDDPQVLDAELKARPVPHDLANPARSDLVKTALVYALG